MNRSDRTLSCIKKKLTYGVKVLHALHLLSWKESSSDENFIL